MRINVIVASSVLSAAMAFPMTTTQTSAVKPLHASKPFFASWTAGNPQKDKNGVDNYVHKPLYQPQSTESIPVKKVTKAQRQRMADTVIDPDFSLTWAMLALGPLIAWYHPGALIHCS